MARPPQTGHVSGLAEGDSDALAKLCVVSYLFREVVPRMACLIYCHYCPPSAKVLQQGPSAADVADVEIKQEEDISSKKYTSFDVQR